MPRPKLKIPADKSILLHLTAKQHAHLQRIAVAEGRSMSDVMRGLIENARDYEFTPTQISAKDDFGGH